MDKMKVLALYLPQYHRIPENDEWWGNGYTEWTAVKGAKPLFRGHEQPKIPLNKNYYDLSDETGDVWSWQASLARKYGVYGFCIYHYWFGHNKMLLQKPMEILLKHPEIEINYCICWANETWSRNWYGQFNQVLIAQKYEGSDDYTAHFLYLLPFFMDSRYIKIQNKPVVNIYMTSKIGDFDQLVATWNKLALEHGFNGIFFVSARKDHLAIESRKSLIDAFYNYEPGYTEGYRIKKIERFLEYTHTLFAKTVNRVFKTNLVEHFVDSKRLYKKMRDYNELSDKPVFPGMFVSWDNTPRRGKKGSVYLNTSVQGFEKQLLFLRDHALKLGYANEYIYINAWNEWGEGCYLEPDSKNEYAFLEAIKHVFVDK